MRGYKATDKDIRCRGYQFVPGEWHEVAGELVLCGNGFHFCEHPSGVWAYYSDATTRVWEVEAEDVLETPPEPGADFKQVCRRIRLVKEITPGGNRNTGYGNTGYGNTGYGNTGYGNTGYGNTGNRNTGYGNTGYGNTGDGNTGDRNTGDRNTGNRNTGDRNTGNRNTGDGSTGDGNATNNCAGFFCAAEPPVVSFDIPTTLTRAEYAAAYPEYWDLCQALGGEAEILFEPFARLPGITPEKLKALHDKHRAGRKAVKQ